MATIKNIHDYSDIINLPYKKSKKYYDQATKLCIAIKDWQTLGKVYNNYSVNLYEQNQK